MKPDREAIAKALRTTCDIETDRAIVEFLHEQADRGSSKAKRLLQRFKTAGKKTDDRPNR